jgi:hypothetical protein
LRTAFSATLSVFDGSFAAKADGMLKKALVTAKRAKSFFMVSMRSNFGAQKNRVPRARNAVSWTLRNNYG